MTTLDLHARGKCLQIQNRKYSVRTIAVLAKTDVWQAGLRQSLRGWQMGQGSRALAVFQKTEVQFPASTPGSAQPDTYTHGTHSQTHTHSLTQAHMHK